VFSLEIRGPDGNVGVARVTEIPTVCIPLHRRRVPKVILKSLKGIKLLDDYDRDKSFSVDILIGLDQYWRFVKPEIVPVSESLVIQNTMFGWMLSGMYELAPSDGRLVSVEASPQLFCVQGVSDDELRGMWDLEVEDESRQTDPVLSRFNETIRLKEGRYEVQLPWKGNAGQLVDNFRAAEMRLRSLSRKLVREPDLKIRYDQALEEMETNEVVEEVPPEEMYSMTRAFICHTGRWLKRLVLQLRYVQFSTHLLRMAMGCL